MCVKFTYIEDNRGTGPVKVTFRNFVHSGLCVPSPNQLVVARKASGDYGKMSDALVTTIMTLPEHDPGTSTRALQAMIEEAYPARKSISAQEIFNMKVRVNLLRDEMVATGKLAATKANFVHLFKGLDDEDSDIIDSASKHVHEMIRSVLSSTVHGWKLIALLKKMHEADPAFTYRVDRDDNGCPSGVVWQTPQMRANFERYGCFISIDAMKRQQNSLHWPYIGPVVLDESKTVAVIAESIVLGERMDAYHFVLDSIFQMAPKRKRSEVSIIASDCFVNESLLEDLGISGSCRLMWDHYHILESIWPCKHRMRLRKCSKSGFALRHSRCTR